MCVYFSHTFTEPKLVVCQQGSVELAVCQTDSLAAAAADDK